MNYKFKYRCIPATAFFIAFFYISLYVFGNGNGLMSGSISESKEDKRFLMQFSAIPSECLCNSEVIKIEEVWLEARSEDSNKLAKERQEPESKYVLIFKLLEKPKSAYYVKFVGAGSSFASRYGSEFHYTYVNKDLEGFSLEFWWNNGNESCAIFEFKKVQP